MSEDALIAARKLAERRFAMGIDPRATAAACGGRYDGDAEGVITLPFLGAEVRLTYPQFELAPGETLPSHVAALLVYYLACSDGSLPVNHWVSLADLPNGEFYVNAFRGYTGAILAREFGQRPEALASAIAVLGATELPGLADLAWRIPALPLVPIALLWWNADDEFDARAELLFDVTAPNHLPTDGCAVLGSWTTATLLRLAGRR